MNDVVFPGQTGWNAAGQGLKNVVWSTASQLSLHGLCPMDVEDRWVMFERRDMFLPGLGASLEGLRVVHLSDLHLGPLLRERHLRTYVEMVNRLDPDYIVLTGDYISSSTRHYIRRLRSILSECSPRVETLAVLGNHDYGLYHPTQPVSRGLAEYMIDQLTQAEIHVLMSQSRSYTREGSSVCFVGLGDLWTEDYRPAMAFDNLPADRPTIALVHNPDAAPRLADLGATYVLAGHTHGRGVKDTKMHRMLFPTKYIEFIAGAYPLGKGRQLYVNRGLGPSRRGCRNTRPEITIFTMRNAERATTKTTWLGATDSQPFPLPSSWTYRIPSSPEPSRL